jgi:hypothetical protein
MNVYRPTDTIASDNLIPQVFSQIFTETGVIIYSEIVIDCTEIAKGGQTGKGVIIGREKGDGGKKVTNSHIKLILT